MMEKDQIKLNKTLQKQLFFIFASFGKYCPDSHFQLAQDLGVLKAGSYNSCLTA